MDTSSSEEISSSDCEVESSCEDDSEKFETAKICGATLDLPQRLCEDKDIFKEFFSLKTWNSLSEINKQHLKNFLPCFPDNDEQEKNVTLQKLFNREKFRFNSPLMHFQEKLQAGHFRPDIVKIKNLMKQAQRKECMYQQQIYYRKLTRDLIASKQRLLDLSNSLPPGIEPRTDKLTSNHSIDICAAAHRTKRRYFQELSTIKSLIGESAEWSEDENYPEGPPVQLSKKQKRHLNGLQGTTLNLGIERAITSTLAKKASGFDLENSVTSTHNPYQLNEDSYRALLMKHKKRKLEYDLNPDLITNGITMKDIAQRTQLTPVKKTNGKLLQLTNSEIKCNKKKIKVEPSNKAVNNSYFSEVIKQPPLSSNSEPEYSDSDSLIDPVMSPIPSIKSKSPRAKTPKPKQSSPRNAKGKSIPLGTNSDFEIVKPKIEPDILKPKIEPDTSFPEPTLSPISQYSNRILPASLSDLDGIDMMNLPVDLDDSNIDILDEINVKQELMQDTHSNFLSLIRDIICSTMDHRMALSNLEDRLKAWQENPISPLNDWYCLVDNWVNLLPSAIAFLTGDVTEQPEEFVPYLEYKPMLQVYQWIGAGRDSDNLLLPLCLYWLDHREDTVLSNNTQEIEIDVIEKSQTPPPPRYPTQWNVRKAEPEEIEQFQEQERQRYSNPHKAFTYRMNGYESVVGPVKGMYNQSAGVSKARGHSMLSADRPNFVTILTLVRDATARLPNGEGTRAEICELLKSSQYISQTAPENVLQSVVSGALDRMHTEFDPCVKYDTKRKIWIYLHRNRSESDFERIHQQCQGMSKQLKKANRKSKPKPKQEKAAKVNAGNKTTTSDAQTVTSSSNSVSNNIDKGTKTFKTPVCRIFTVPTTSSTTSNVQIPTVSPNKQVAGTSLLVNSNVSTLKPISSPKAVSLQTSEKPESIGKNILSTAPPNSPSNSGQPERQIKIVSSTIAPTKQDIEEVIQTLTPIRVTSPITKQIASPKSNKSLVKIINSPQGKSLISPVVSGSNQQPTVFIKQVDQKAIGSKQLLTQPQITQQLIQSITAQQKQLKTPQQVVQINQSQKSITVVTSHQLLKTVDQKPVQTIATQQIIHTSTHQPQTVTTQATTISHQLLQAINQQKQNQVVGLTSAQQQQQQILQTIKQKVVQQQQNQQTVLTLQQAVLKQQQQASIQHLQKQIQQQQQQQIVKGTSLLGQQRIITQVAGKTTNQHQTPLVAKVLTNAAGQVISVESLLAHQKQHGSLPQGTTLRVSGAKPGQTNLIQLSSNTPNQMTQFAVVSQNNIVSVANQQRLTTTVTVPNQPTTTTASISAVTTTKPVTKTYTKSITTTKFVQSKLNHQLVNAKFITQNVATNKLLPQQKIVVNQTNQVKLNTATKPLNVSKSISNVNQTGNTVRMVNTAGLNIAHIAGKPVLLASKGNTIQNIQGQNVILQAQPNITTSSTGSIVLPNSTRVIQGGQVVTQQSQSQTSTQMVLGTQLKVQNMSQNLVQTNASQVMLGHNIKTQNNTQQPTQNQTVVLGGHTIKVPAGAQNNQRVVLASQGQGGQLVAQQILLPSGFQGSAINIKTLQGLKVIPLTQSQQSKGRPQQVFARIMNPTNATRINQVTSSQSSSQLDGGGSQTNAD